MSEVGTNIVAEGDGLCQKLTPMSEVGTDIGAEGGADFVRNLHQCLR